MTSSQFRGSCFNPNYTSGQPNDNMIQDPMSIGYTWRHGGTFGDTVHQTNLPALKVGTYLVTCNICAPSSGRVNMFVAYDSNYCLGGLEETYDNTISKIYGSCYGDYPSEYGVSNFYVLCNQSSGANTWCGNGTTVSATGLLYVYNDLPSNGTPYDGLDETDYVQFWFYQNNYDTVYYSVEICRQG
jgi:hypothetical protein